jgi:hypothetical protein
LAALTFAGYGRVIRSANKSHSIANIRQVYTYTLNYANENKGIIPPAIPSSGWVWYRVINGDPQPNPLPGYFIDKEVRKKWPDIKGPTYGMNMFGAAPGTGNGVALTSFTAPSKTVLFSTAALMEYNKAYFNYGNGTPVTGWPSRPYDDCALVGFADGHVKIVKANAAQTSGLDLEPEAWRP